MLGRCRTTSDPDRLVGVHNRHGRPWRGRSTGGRVARAAASASVVVACLWCLAVGAAELAGTVVRVVDGDTVVLEVGQGRHRIRLAGIDAPEQNQPWGEVATEELRRRVAGRPVVVDWYGQDQWRQSIGVVHLAGEDLNLHMVGRGLAWQSDRIQDELPPGDREAYAEAERSARDARRGLWSDPDPVPPWEWRMRR